MGERGLYFYALSRDLDAERLRGRTGIGEAPLRTVGYAELTAVVSEVDLAEFGEEGLARNLEDLAWLADVATAHDRVARLAWEQATTVPARLGTVFLSEESLRARLAGWQEGARSTMREVEGRDEWSLKVYVDQQPDRARVRGATERSEPEPAAGSSGTGTAYLMQRREAARRREQQTRAAAEAAERLQEAAAERAVASRRLALHDRRTSGHQGEMLLNAAYLVDREDVGEFREAVSDVAARFTQIRVELGGPWPPYSFVVMEEP